MSESKASESHPDAIAEALREAGGRPPLEPLDLDHLGAPALAVWERQMARRRFRRRVLALAAGIGAMVFSLWRLDTPAPSRPIGVVLAVAGEGRSGRAPGSEVARGQLLATSEQPAEWLTVELYPDEPQGDDHHGGHRLRLDAGSELRLDSATEVELLRGGLYVEAAPADLELVAGDTVSEHVGTRYEVRIDAGTAAVRVRDGRVRVRRGTRTVEIGRGEQVRSSSGELELGPSPAHGESWAWTLRAMPPFQTDGIELESFLEWIEAESGWRLDVDPALLLDPAGEPARVRGSVGDLPPEEALARVLESAGLRHRFEGDRVRIRAP